MNQRLLLLLFLAFLPPLFAQDPLPGTPLLEPAATPDQRSVAMVAGIGKWLHRESERVTADRHQRWAAAAKSGRWEEFTAAKRQELATVLGLETERPAAVLQKQEEGDGVRWSVFDGVHGEGLLLTPGHAPLATVIVVPDADELPEQCALALTLRKRGCQVLVPVLVSRADDFSGNDAVRFTNQPHREWIQRQAFEMGRTLIGYEVQKVLAAVDALHPSAPLYLAGHGEGGVIALRAAALDSRFRGVLLSGAFAAHNAYEAEPIYRNLFGAWQDFGDAELAALVAPRQVVVELSDFPAVAGPPAPRAGRGGAAPGAL